MEVVDNQVLLNEGVAIRNVINQLLMEGGAFTLWRMPNSSEKVLFICNSGVVELDEVTIEDSEPGFVFAPFQPNQKKLFLKAELVFKFKGNGQIETAHSILHSADLSATQRRSENKIHFSKKKKGTNCPLL